MEEVTRLIEAAEAGEPHAAEELLPIVYEELRRMAAHKMAQERPGQTLQATALVHEAYLKLVNPDKTEVRWNGRGHFFGAAAEAMRRILVDNARRKAAMKHGGQHDRVEFKEGEVVGNDNPEYVMAVDEALSKFGKADPQKAKLVELRFFAGLTIPEAAAALGVSEATAQRQWAYARAWLGREIGRPD